MSTIQAYFEGINDEHYDDVGALFAADGVLIAPGVSPRVGPVSGLVLPVKALARYPKHYDDPTRVIDAGSTVTVEIHFTGELDNGAPMEFDAVDVFDLNADGKIVKLSSWYDSHAVRKTLRTALEHGRLPPDSWSVPPERARAFELAPGIWQLRLPLPGRWFRMSTRTGSPLKACSSTAGRRGIRPIAPR